MRACETGVFSLSGLRVAKSFLIRFLALFVYTYLDWYMAGVEELYSIEKKGEKEINFLFFFLPPLLAFIILLLQLKHVKERKEEEEEG